ncbi:MAG TPA: pectate lyase [Candidatus Limnocylindria bacterium]|nr:pectate lyase [Candidatus Limnocylindria bacterium]
MTHAVLLLAAIFVAVPAEGAGRRELLDALVAEQQPAGGWVFAAPPGKRPQPLTQVVGLAERLAAPLGLATWDLLVLRSPGTPAAALELLAGGVPERQEAYDAAARRAAHLLADVQLEPGGWFSEMPLHDGRPAWWFRQIAWRMTLDDDVTPGAIRALLAVWERTREESLRLAARRGLDLLHQAQLPDGAFPIVWRPPWLHRLHESQEDAPSLNDGATPLAIETLLEAARVFRDPRHLDAASRAGDWLLSVQLGEPAPGWAQQYNAEVRPAPGRGFEPAALATWETRHAAEALLALAEATREVRYCQAAARAVRWLARVSIASGCWPRFVDLADGSPVYVGADGMRVDGPEQARPGYSWTGEFGIPQLLARLGLDAAGRRRGRPHPAPAPLPGDPGTCPGGGPHAPELEGPRLLAAAAARERAVAQRGAEFCAAAFD